MLPPPSPIETNRLILSPLEIEDAGEMVAVLSDESIYRFTGGHPPSLQALEARYASQVAGSSSPEEHWRNWILRLLESSAAIGFVQATIQTGSADIAWVVAPEWQSLGLATEAAQAMSGWLVANGVDRLTAHIHPDHVSSQGVATKLGLSNTREIDEDGEEIWVN